MQYSKTKERRELKVGVGVIEQHKPQISSFQENSLREMEGRVKIEHKSLRDFCFLGFYLALT